MREIFSFNAAEAIPYTDFNDRNNKVNEELQKNRFVEIMDELKIIYSAEKWQ